MQNKKQAQIKTVTTLITNKKLESQLSEEDLLVIIL